MKKSRLLFLLISALFLFAAQELFAGTVTWVAPLDGSFFDAPEVDVAGFFTAPTASPGEIRIKNVKTGRTSTAPIKLFLEKRAFKAKLNLSEGENHLTIGGSVLKVMVVPGAKTGGAEGFKAKNVHWATVEKCESCHSIWQGELALNEAPPKLCTQCHDVGRKITEARFKDNEHSQKLTPFCIGCHLPHGSEFPSLLKWDDTNTCTRCHTELGSGKGGHHKMGGQSCAACHDPHQSSYPNLLKEVEERKLCVPCHKDAGVRAPGSMAVHQAAMGKRCFTCHSNHQTRFGSNLKDGIPALCVACHEERSVPDHQADFTDCRLCHEPHQSKRRGLVKDETGDLCSKCHGSMKKGKGHMGDGNGNCGSCHNPHEDIGQTPAYVCDNCHRFSTSSFAAAHEGLPIEDAEQCAYCHDPHKEDDGEGRFYGALHYPVGNGGCKVCHVIEDDQISLKYDKSETCYRCHGETVGGGTASAEDLIHNPVAKDACTACHDPHVKHKEKMLLEEPQALCVWCHGGSIGNKEIMHGALEDEDCRLCHRAHISDYVNLLVTPQPDICLECHDDVFDKPPTEDKLAHGIVKEGRCGACHDPHSEDNHYLIRGGLDQACKTCHPKVLLDEKGNPWPDLHGPVAADSCSACHDLTHSHERSLEDDFLPVEVKDRICDDCHDVSDDHIPIKVRNRERTSPQNCLVCHNPHGARNSLMLKRLSY